MVQNGTKLFNMAQNGKKIFQNGKYVLQYTIDFGCSIESVAFIEKWFRIKNDESEIGIGIKSMLLERFHFEFRSLPSLTSLQA